MRYVISDIHGCYEEYMELLEKMKLSEANDQLYILGDALDRGPEPMKVLLDIMKRKNVTYITGNHDYLFCYFIHKLGLDLSLAENMLPDDISDFRTYLLDGGITTIESFMKLSLEERQAVYDFLKNAKAYDEMLVDDKRYVLVHADNEATIYIGNGHIAIDCGCVYGKRLAAYCLEMGGHVYVDAKKIYWE